MFGQVIFRPLLIGLLVCALAPRAVSAQPERPAGPSARIDPWRGCRPASGPPATLLDPKPRLLAAVTQGQPVEPVHAVSRETLSAGERASITQKWWFWAAVGALAVSATVLVVAATRGAEAPRTRLGNMEAFR